MRDIHFGYSQTDLNLCDPASHFYKAYDTSFNLSSNYALIHLESQTPNVIKDLYM